MSENPSELVVAIPDDADTGLVRTRVQKALVAAGRHEDASTFISETDDLRSDIAATLRAAAAYVSIEGGPAVGAALASGGDDDDTRSRQRPSEGLWEYKVVKNMTGNALEETLNRLGRDRWELVSIAGLDGVFTLTGNKIFAVLKRPTSFNGYASLSG